MTERDPVRRIASEARGAGPGDPSSYPSGVRDRIRRIGTAVGRDLEEP